MGTRGLGREGRDWGQEGRNWGTQRKRLGTRRTGFGDRREGVGDRIGAGLGTGGPARGQGLTGLCRIIVTRFFCSMRLKSWRRSPAPLRARRNSGSSWGGQRGPGAGGSGRGSGLAAVLILRDAGTRGVTPGIQIGEKAPKTPRGCARLIRPAGPPPCPAPCGDEGTGWGHSAGRESPAGGTGQAELHPCEDVIAENGHGSAHRWELRTGSSLHGWELRTAQLSTQMGAAAENRHSSAHRREQELRTGTTQCIGGSRGQEQAQLSTPTRAENGQLGTLMGAAAKNGHSSARPWKRGLRTGTAQCTSGRGC